MFKTFLKLSLLSLLLISCSKKTEINTTPIAADKGYETYNEAVKAMDNGDYFYAANKFKESETIIPRVEDAAKALIMSSYCFYAINFYPDMRENLELFLSKYRANEYLVYAKYLLILANYEQINDEKKDISPLLKTKADIISFLNKYPENEYSLDLKFKIDLINNQLAAKELFISKYYIQTKKWIPAINRLQNIVKNYDETIFVEEALHRLVEVYYKVGLTEEATKAAALLGYNYNSSEWYKRSYKVLNKNYKIQDKKKVKDLGLLKRTLEKILN